VWRYIHFGSVNHSTKQEIPACTKEDLESTKIYQEHTFNTTTIEEFNIATAQGQIPDKVSETAIDQLPNHKRYGIPQSWAVIEHGDETFYGTRGTLVYTFTLLFNQH
jgi:hypothetical protein